MTGERWFSEGRAVRLGRRLGGGGEGEVFAVARRPALAAKLYRPGIAASREAKIAAMLGGGMAADAPRVAFPQAALHDETGRFAGFLMAKVARAAPLHELYAPGARKRAFPEADYRFVLRAALNAARAVAAAHRAGCVIGDVNHSGFLIGQDALVALIDADSFQVADGGVTHLCAVGVPEYTPPELQGRSLAGVTRTADHDAFGLAVVLFQLLFLGRHPFTGVSEGGDLAVEDAIARCAYAWSKRPGPLSPPPSAPLPDETPRGIAALFERAFAPGEAGRRPSAEEWVAALAAAEGALEVCGADPRHVHFGSLARCPWCRIEAAGRVKLFPAPGAPGSAPRPMDAAALRRRLDAIALPSSFACVPPEPLPSSAPPLPTPRQVWLNRAGVAGLAFMMLCAAGLVWVSPQSFLMAAPICIYGYGPVSGALAPRHAARRALKRLDGEIAEALAVRRARAGLDAAWTLKAELAALAAPGSRAARADAARIRRDLARLSEMAAALAEGATARDPEIEALLARRKALVEDLAARGETAPALALPPPRALRDATRRRAVESGLSPS
ncbi:hypothetical protein [Rubrimonas cliftonensis]|uniref:Protein kinase domain-containing protein n=1 Tax=Rubrimonas cliftonensis TaxID=89524 RepID=A0A1H4EIV6_9RHOB|nr:hypothetical protein [Rubrimonas cliftonensis]SEA84628.1 hypothetical protein SAMN05444370_11419 [Rubrimonas cliftonensis]